MDRTHSTDQPPASGLGAGFADLDAIVSHVPELVRSRDVRRRVFGDRSISRINGAIAVAATHALSSMWFFWFCVALDLFELPAVLHNLTPIVFVTYISQTVIQLLALPLLGAGQQIIAEAQDARAEADHKTLTALHAMNVTQLAILRRLEKLEKGR